MDKPVDISDLVARLRYIYDLHEQQLPLHLERENECGKLKSLHEYLLYGISGRQRAAEHTVTYVQGIADC